MESKWFREGWMNENKVKVKRLSCLFQTDIVVALGSVLEVELIIHEYIHINIAGKCKNLMMDRIWKLRGMC